MLADGDQTNPLRSAALWNPQVRAAAVVAVIFFSCSLVVFITSALLRGEFDLRYIFGVGVPMMIVDGFIAFQLVFLLRWASRFPMVPRIALLGLGVLVVAVLQAMWDTQLRIWAGTVWKDYGTPYLALVRAGTLDFYHASLFVALLAFQASNMSLREKQRELGASRASERDAHMMALRYQLNPHFLFNTLNSISSLVITGRTEQSEEMIDRLSTFLRASLTADPRSLVRLDEEFDMLHSYLEIEGVRFGERLVTSLDLPAELAGARIPPFLLQPIVENAIKYAVAPSHRAVHVRVAAEATDGQLLLSVVDDGDGCAEVSPGTGVGLANVRERLKLRFGEAASVVKFQDEHGCRVEIRAPLRTPDSPAVRSMPSSRAA